MAYLLRALVLVMFIGVILTASTALGYIQLDFSHIEIAIPVFIFTIFIQAFVMFYFIGVSRFVTNIYNMLAGEQDLDQLFENKPENLDEYIAKVKRFHYQSTLSKRQTIPWTLLMLTLGSIGFLLGAAHDTGMVRKIVHSGVIYSFMVTMTIGFVRQWQYLGKSHKLLREIKHLFSISSDSM